MSNLSLYHIAAQYREDIDKLSDLDLPAEVIADTLESMGGDLEVKVNNVVLFARNLESLAEQIKQAEDAMAKRRKALENRAEHLRKYTLQCMQLAGVKKIEGPMLRVAIQKGRPSVEVFDERQIPPEFLRTPPVPQPAPDKAAIKAAIDAGREVPGCRIKQDDTLSIK